MQWERHAPLILAFIGQVLAVGIVYGTMSQWQTATEVRMNDFDQRILRESARVSVIEEKKSTMDISTATQLATILEKMSNIEKRIETK